MTVEQAVYSLIPVDWFKQRHMYGGDFDEDEMAGNVGKYIYKETYR